MDHSSVLYVFYQNIYNHSNVQFSLLRVIDNSTNMGATYLKTCDSQYNALALIKKEMKPHGSDPITLDAPLCDPDGSYYSKQCDGSTCSCKTRANEIIGAYNTERNTDSERDQKCCISFNYFLNLLFIIIRLFFISKFAQEI